MRLRSELPLVRRRMRFKLIDLNVRRIVYRVRSSIEFSSNMQWRELRL